MLETRDEMGNSGMPVSRNLINRSKENWESYQMLTSVSKNNAAANRLYYSIFHLVYAEMVNNATKPGFTDDQKLGYDSKGKHEASLRYILKKYNKLGGGYAKLLALRVKADYSYSDISVMRDELKECYNFWAPIREKIVEDLKSQAERMII